MHSHAVGSSANGEDGKELSSVRLVSVSVWSLLVNVKGDVLGSGKARFDAVDSKSGSGSKAIKEVNKEPDWAEMLCL